MAQALSMDLRARLLSAVDDGMSCRGAAARFDVAPSTAIRWQAQRRETGGFAPKPQGGDMRSRRVEERCDVSDASAPHRQCHSERPDRGL